VQAMSKEQNEPKNLDGVLRIVGKAVLEKGFLEDLHKDVRKASKEIGVPLSDAEVKFVEELVSGQTLDNFVERIGDIRAKWKPDKGR
jgi:hypothetical protein